MCDLSFLGNLGSKSLVYLIKFDQSKIATLFLLTKKNIINKLEKNHFRLKNSENGHYYYYIARKKLSYNYVVLPYNAFCHI